MIVAIGQKVRFDPFLGLHGYGVEACRSIVTGTVVMVNEAHEWFSVEYGNPKMRTSFRFDDIGTAVKICG